MQLAELLQAFHSQPLATEIRRGLEKESLRVTPEGRIAKTPHPQALGSALTHPFITTDFSESLLEFVTPVFSNPVQLLKFLEDLHIFTVHNIDDEILWANSMPCFLESDEDIPIANYGPSNIGQMKRVYRTGLHHRYGSAMQAISGIHFNFSLSDRFFTRLQEIVANTSPLQEFKSCTYMSIARNVHRYSWVIPYFMGSSPAICKSFLTSNAQSFDLKPFDDQGTVYFEGSTSLRLSNLGYTNAEQGQIEICYNSLESYVKGLRHAITTPYEPWQKIGLRDDQSGTYKQLNGNLLQIENEYYAEVRPKQPTHSGESPTHALLHRGIEYIELRSVDINSFSPIGIELEQILFLDIFLLYCLFEEPTPHTLLSQDQTRLFRKNQELIAKHGRLPNLKMFDGQEYVSAYQWAQQLFEKFQTIAQHLDAELEEEHYTQAIQSFYHKIDHSELLPSSQLLQDMKSRNESFFTNILWRSQNFSHQWRKKTIRDEQVREFTQQATTSLLSQKELEQNDHDDFENFLNTYIQQNL